MKLDWLNRYNLLLFETIDSTNSEALRLASAGAIGDFVITSTKQTGGRGTKGREWFSAPGNLHTTILLQIDHHLQNCLQLNFIASHSLYEAIEYIAKNQDLKLNMKFKWPNDLLINHSKVAGILLESIMIKEKRYLIIGFGVNIVKKPLLHIKTTSLQEQGVKLSNVDFFLNILVSKFEKNYQNWKLRDNFIQLKENWLQKAFRFNQEIKIKDNRKITTGFFKDISIDGEIVVLLKNKQYKKIAHGSIISSELEN